MEQEQHEYSRIIFRLHALQFPFPIDLWFSQVQHFRLETYERCNFAFVKAEFSRALTVCTAARENAFAVESWLSAPFGYRDRT
jgi:hypothetical protein